MRSVRFDPELDERVRRAAALEGVSVSEFIRVAAADRATAVLGRETMADLWADYIGAAGGSGSDGPATNLAGPHGDVFGDLVADKHARTRQRRAG